MSLAGLEHGGQGDRHGCGSLLVADRQEWSWLVLLLLVHPFTQWLEQPLVQTVHGCRLSAMEAFGRIFSSSCGVVNLCLLVAQSLLFREDLRYQEKS